MFAKVAQVQFRAVLDALNEQVNRLGQVQGGEERGEERTEYIDDHRFSSTGVGQYDPR